MKMNKLWSIDIKDDKIIKYINSEMKANEEDVYANIKADIKTKYKNIKTEDKLKELRDIYYYRKVALESMSPENLTVGMISILSILVAILAILIDIKIIDIEIKESYIVFSTILIVLIVSIFLLRNRIIEKSKKMVYYTIELEVIDELLRMYSRSRNKICYFRRVSKRIRE